MLGSAESEMVRLINPEIIFAEFKPITIPQVLNVTDRRTDNLPWHWQPVPSEAYAVKIIQGVTNKRKKFKKHDISRVS